MKELRTYGKEVAVQVEIFDGCKYEKSSSVKELATYSNLKEWYIITGADVEEIESNGLIDENHEYLELHFSDGTTATFRNSHVDMFRMF